MRAHNHRIRGHLIRVLWGLLAVPGLLQLGLLLYTVVRRYAYPYDLEWMEGGLLSHADRLSQGQSIYPVPSVEFIPYLYTPLYPALVAVLGSVFGISYQLGRGISIASLIAVVILMVAAIRWEARHDTPDPESRGHSRTAPGRAAPGSDALLWCAGAMAAGFFAATYPWIEGWYDIVRADTLFMAMVLAGLLGLRVWARQPAANGRGQLRVAAMAALLATGFFCKQTGVLYVAAGGALLLVGNWRRLPVFVLVAGMIGLGGTAIFNSLTDGWFWTYTFEVHQAHDFNIDRFYLSFWYILGQFPLMTATIVAALVAVLATWAIRKQRPRYANGLLAWSFIFAVSCLVGALGWGTQWAHFNAYMPAMTTGALTAGISLGAIHACAALWLPAAWRDRRAVWLPHATAAVCAVLLGGQLWVARWQPAGFIPTERDLAAGHALIDQVRQLRRNGDVYLPFHPWYARLAGQEALYTHRMGLMDLGYQNRWQIADLRESFRRHRFAAVIVDKHPPGWEFVGLRQHYRPDGHIPQSMQPRLYTGAKVAPHTLWVPVDPEPPPGAQVLFDFEDRRLDRWRIGGTAWGKRPVDRPRRGQQLVQRYRGRYYVTSMHGGDKSTGTLTSPRFVIAGDRISFRMSGGADPHRLRIELRIVADEPEDYAHGHLVHTAVNARDDESMREVSWDVSAYRGQSAVLLLIDDAQEAWGHLNADDFLLW